MLISKIEAESSAALDFTLGNLYAQADNNSKAVIQYRAAIDKFPDFQRAHINLGVVLIQLGQNSDALSELLRALELGAEDGNIYGLIGGDINSIQPEKRMLSSMTPTIIEKNNELAMI